MEEKNKNEHVKRTPVKRDRHGNFFIQTKRPTNNIKFKRYKDNEGPAIPETRKQQQQQKEKKVKEQQVKQVTEQKEPDQPSKPIQTNAPKNQWVQTIDSKNLKAFSYNGHTVNLFTDGEGKECANIDDGENIILGYAEEATVKANELRKQVEDKWTIH